MTPLTQQLEDKKKGLMNDQEMRDYIMSEFVNSGFITVHQWRNFVDYLQIMIKRQLEQAIAEIQKRDKDIDELAESSTFALCALMKENKELKDEMQKQSQQQNHEMTEKECGANTTVEVDKITDTPQEKMSEVQFKALFPDIEKSPVVSNLQFPELEPKKCFSDGFDKGVQFGMQKQRQEEIEFLKSFKKDKMNYYRFKNAYMNREIEERIKKLEQLNQPKTEK